MAKKEKAPLSESLLKAWGAVAFIGLTGRLFCYIPKEDAKADRAPKKHVKRPWLIFTVTILIALAVIAALVIGYLVLRQCCFPTYRMPIELIAVIGVATVFVLGTVITVIEARIHKR